MPYNYLILALSWIVYCILHSVLASIEVKLFFKKAGNKFWRYYRLGYTIFATITLIFVLWFQYSLKSSYLIHSLYLKYFSCLLLVLPGIIIMAIAILKYFRLLSGVRSLFMSNPPSNLKIDGIHKYIRHPLYLGTLLFIWGVFLIFPLLTNLISVVIITLYTIIGIKFEEKKLLREFGEAYADYINKVPAIIPKF
jgi:methanethiol S-methyltransferase